MNTPHASLAATPRSAPKRSRPRLPARAVPAPTVDPLREALRLLQRQARIRDDLRGRRVSHIVAERELLRLRHQLAQFPAAVQAIGLVAHELRRPLDSLSIRDVEKRSGRLRAVTRDSVTHTANPR